MSDITWMEISVEVDGEMAEPVAEVLARFIPDGVVIESTAVTANPDDSEGRAIGPLRVSGYLAVDDKLETTRQRLEEALWYLSRIRPMPAPQFRVVHQADWAEAWKAHFQPIAVGKDLMIIPAWLESPSAERIPIRIDPGMAFGTGTHPTTQLCLEFISELKASSDFSQIDVIDLGCGSGILAIAALKLGARHALGVDIDAEATPASQQNAENNRVADRLELGLGSLPEIRAGAFSLRQASVVVANILAPVIVRLLDEGLGDIVAEEGSLVLSGILAEQAPDVARSLNKHGFTVIEQRLSGDWVALLARR
jgi:ribosomal protein L11 methyltransferase